MFRILKYSSFIEFQSVQTLYLSISKGMKFKQFVQQSSILYSIVKKTRFIIVYYLCKENFQETSSVLILQRSSSNEIKYSYHKLPFRIRKYCNAQRVLFWGITKLTNSRALILLHIFPVAFSSYEHVNVYNWKIQYQCILTKMMILF